MVRKWHTLIEAHTKVKTTDGYILRMFCMAFTKRRQEQVKNTCYAGSAQIRKIRKKMVEVMQKEASKSMLRDLVKKLKFDLTKLMELHSDSLKGDVGMEMT